MAFITPDDTCGCCEESCENYPCQDSGPSTTPASAIVVTFAAHSFLGTNYNHSWIDLLPSIGPTVTYRYQWCRLTDISSIYGNYTIARDTENCGGNTITLSGFSVTGIVYGCNDLDIDGCPTGTIEEYAFTHSDNTLTVAFSQNTNGITFSFGSNTEPDNGLEITAGGLRRPYVFSWQELPANVQCAGGPLSLDVFVGPVGGSLFQCPAYPLTIGSTCNYSFTP